MLPTPTTTPEIAWGDLSFWKSPEYEKIKTLVSKTPDIRPRPDLIFRPLIMTPLHKVRVVILAKEPHLDEDYADGLALSAQGSPLSMKHYPAETVNLLRELSTDQGFPLPTTTNLATWARQGVLLINDTWTAQKGKSYSHYRMGWERLTEEVLETVYLVNPNVVYLLFEPVRYGLIDKLPSKANIIKVKGPYASTAYSGFFNSRPFSKINQILAKTGQRKINWRLPT